VAERKCRCLHDRTTLGYSSTIAGPIGAQGTGLPNDCLCRQSRHVVIQAGVVADGDFHAADCTTPRTQQAKRNGL
jgi:hypothetical protein